MGRLPSDEALLAGLRSGDEDTFAQLVDAWTPAMLHLARAHVATRESAADVVQDTWLAVIRGIGDFEGRSSLRTWVFRILTNIAKSRGVRERRTVPWGSLFDDGPAGPTVDPGRFRGPGDPYPGHWREFPASWTLPEASALDGEIRRLLYDVIDALPARQREVVSLRDVAGYTSEEVCDLLGLTAGNQRVLLHRGRAAVRASLESYLAAPRTGTGQRAVR